MVKVINIKELFNKIQKIEQLIEQLIEQMIEQMKRESGNQIFTPYIIDVTPTTYKLNKLVRH